MIDVIHVLNGPNLNLLGTRQPEVYGATTLADIEAMCGAAAERLELGLVFAQSNSEGGLVDLVQAAAGAGAAGIVINPAAYTHTSVAVLDALNTFGGLVVEVHLSQVHRREAFRHRSLVSRRADAGIAGCGPQGYVLALDYLSGQLAE